MDEEDAGRTIEELDAIADADRREAALARAPEEVGTTTEDARASPPKNPNATTAVERENA